MQSNLYNILGLSSDASAADIKRAYRRLAMQFHPDRNTEPESIELFRQVQRAYDVLSDKDRRAAYDRGEPIEATITLAKKIEREALERLIIVFNMAIDNIRIDRVSSYDIPKEIRFALGRGMTGIETGKQEIREELKKLRAIRRRLVKAEFYFFDHLRDKRRAAINSYRSLRVEAKIIEQMNLLLDGIEYSVEPQPAHLAGIDPQSIYDALMRGSIDRGFRFG